MAHPSGRPKTSRPPQAGPWALLWLSGIAGCAWLPLLLADNMPWPRQALPVVATTPPSLASTGAPAIPFSPTGQPWHSADSLEPNQAAGKGTWAVEEGPIRQARSWRPMAVNDPAPDRELPLTSFSSSPSDNRPETNQKSPVSDAVLLGGPLGLESLKERPMVPAARLEQALRAQSSDRLEAVPLRWRPAMKALIKDAPRVLPAEVVRVPAPHLKAPEEYPMAVKSDGIAETTVTPSPASKERLERWAERQTASPENSVRPVMVVLEPLETEPNASGDSKIN